VKNIKSKIDCWGSENETVNIKKIKRKEDNELEKIFKPQVDFLTKIDQDLIKISNTFSKWLINYPIYT
jgi:hypothetical protein